MQFWGVTVSWAGDGDDLLLLVPNLNVSARSLEESVLVLAR